MTATLETPARPQYAARVSPHGRRRRRFGDDWPFRRILVVVVALIGAGVMLYPWTASWFSDEAHAGQVTAYVQQVDTMTEAQRADLLEAARDYNATLPDGPLRDPYTLNAAGEASEVGDGVAAYRSVLNVGAGGMMGVLDIPELGVELPIYHGTSDATLAKGIGHLYGSTLPVGGEGTHAVLTGHSGYASATLLNALVQMRLGDTFTIRVLGETLTYRVDQILTVLPDDTSALRRVPGEDHVTLITCTPIGVNSHRLLVRGTRIPTPPEEAEAAQSVRDGVRDAGFPWWAVVAGGVLVGAFLVTLPLRRRSRGLPRHALESE